MNGQLATGGVCGLVEVVGGDTLLRDQSLLLEWEQVKHSHNRNLDNPYVDVTHPVKINPIAHAF